MLEDFCSKKELEPSCGSVLFCHSVSLNVKNWYNFTLPRLCSVVLGENIEIPSNVMCKDIYTNFCVVVVIVLLFRGVDRLWGTPRRPWSTRWRTCALKVSQRASPSLTASVLHPSNMIFHSSRPLLTPLGLWADWVAPKCFISFALVLYVHITSAHSAEYSEIHKRAVRL